MTHVLGVVPARGGSKGIPRKSVAPVLDRPLLAYTCEAVRASRALTRTILSTDDPGIAEIGRALGLDVPFLRPSELAADDTPILSVLQHLLRTLEGREGYVADGVVLLQPTSPLRRAEHIDEAVRMLRETGADSIVSVVEVPHQLSPVSLLQLGDDGRLRPYGDAPSVTRRQDKPTLYARNGPAVLAVRRGTLLEQNSLYGADSRPLVMSAEESIDVDSAWDLALVEFVLTRRALGAARP